MSKEIYMVAIPCEPNKWGDDNHFSQGLRLKFAGTNGIVAQLATITKLKKCLITKAFVGKAVTRSVATKLAKALGYALHQLFVQLPVDVPVEMRSYPSYLRRIILSLPEPVSDQGVQISATG
jgi:hypothetical protein